MFFYKFKKKNVLIMIFTRRPSCRPRQTDWQVDDSRYHILRGEPLKCQSKSLQLQTSNVTYIITYQQSSCRSLALPLL